MATGYTSCSMVQLGPYLCNPKDYSPSGSSVHAISPARILRWVVISSSRRSSPHRDETHVFHISYISWVSSIAGGFFITEPPGKSKSINWLFVTPWTVAHQVPLSVEFSRQEYWSGSPIPTWGDLLNPGNEPQVSCIASRFFTLWATPEASKNYFWTLFHAIQ